MQQHPVPQAVTAYKFKLVGDMTLKQFIELAIGLVGAWLIFNSGINILLKWTFGPLLGFFGFALAFIPIEDRPLDQWIINFFKAIYKPTQFIFQAKSKQMDIFSPTKSKSQTNQIDLPPPHQLEDYLQTLPSTPTTAFDQAETKYLDHISNLFGALGTPLKKSSSADPSSKSESKTTTSSAPLVKSPVKGVRVRKLLHPQMCLLPHATVYQASPDPKSAAIPTNIKKATAKPKVTKTVAKPIQKPAPQPIKPAPAPPPATPLPQSNQPTIAATFTKDVILPQAQERPNLLTGITLDNAGKIVGNVIIEIRDSKNHPIRALKANKLGQFFISTPLPDGIYHLEAEHPDHRFAIIKLEAKGEVIPPLKIQAQA